jgi:hypothetical protein
MIHLDQYNIDRLNPPFKKGVMSISSCQFLQLIASIDVDNSILDLFKKLISEKFETDFFFNIEETFGNFKGFQVRHILEKDVNLILLDQSLSNFFTYSIYNNYSMINTLKTGVKTNLNSENYINIQATLK